MATVGVKGLTVFSCCDDRQFP